ncbi:WecB/TagA/CpsF family glycosyltransferase [Ciceribacter sp. L1K22]|uniref:WecB/TagA/CpsF family glycosyltransferase n=1 Tax=Ciceribacter sp. L1K22 TaxID=2820275 RepID=UPI001ABE4A1A|nr:WecB/TagA/CpsF family glycosyltransferase [Ciceribacter sp. L1K22]MBO3758339.1 WecB/TagA/CpsF family glycosyltransferase [Ciceribacter sp. L1K22]
MNNTLILPLIASRRSIFGVPVYDLGWESALSFVSDLASLPVGQVHVSFLNANNANILHSDRRYREIVRDHVILPDGIGIDIASWFLNGKSFTANLNGTDFVPALLTYMATPKRIGLIGARQDVLDAAVARFRQHAPWHTFVPVSDGYFHRRGVESVVAELADLKLDILIVGMGTPLQEKWIAEHIREDHARLVIGVGALFDFVAGVVPRAPEAVRRLRFEWAYRLILEPRRLWRRYLIGIPLFMWRVLQSRLSGHDRVRTPPRFGAKPPANGIGRF